MAATKSQTNSKSPTNATKKSNNQNLKAALTYLLGFITGIIFILIEKEDQFVRFHAMQSIVIFGAIFVFNMAAGFVPIFGALANALVSIVTLVLWILLMIKAYQGEKYKLPIAGDIAEKQLKNFK